MYAIQQVAETRPWTWRLLISSKPSLAELKHVSERFIIKTNTERTCSLCGAPAEIWYREDGTALLEYWYENGKRHRVGGPAQIEYHEDGSIHGEAWFENGKLINVLGV